MKYDSLTVEIFNAKNEKIRTMKQKSPDENGVQRMQWMMNQKGVRGPSREKPRSNAGEPGGLQVLPGTYKLRVTFGDQKDSTNVEVQADPRLNVSPAIIESRYAMMKDLEKMTSNLAEATTRLRESLDLVSELETKMKESKRTDLKEAQDKSKAVKDSINALFDKILDKEDKRQGLTRDSEGPVVDIQTAESYIDSNINPINETDRRVFGKAQQSVQKAIDSVNQFYEKTWKEYRSMMEKVTLNPFKDYQPIK